MSCRAGPSWPSWVGAAWCDRGANPDPGQTRPLMVMRGVVLDPAGKCRLESQESAMMDNPKVWQTTRPKSCSAKGLGKSSGNEFTCRIATNSRNPCPGWGGRNRLWLPAPPGPMPSISAEGVNARHRAANFELAELPEVMRYLHSHGVKGYLTFNTLIFPSELPPQPAVSSKRPVPGSMRFIVQDWGNRAV